MANATYTDERGYSWDTETGECIGSPADADFHVNSREAAEWLLARMSEEEADMAAIEARLEAYRQNLERQRRVHINRRRYLEWKYGPQLVELARAMLADGKSRTWQLDHGKVAFRKTTGSIKVRDLDAALPWVVNTCPDAVKQVTTTSILTGQFDNALRETIFSAPEKHPYFDITPPGENVTIETGVGK